jgi:hypothetical protein
MVAPAHFHRRWFIKNGTLPAGHPEADQPVDGYYASEADAKRARKIMVQCYGIPAKHLPIAHEDVSAPGPKQT